MKKGSFALYFGLLTICMVAEYTGHGITHALAKSSLMPVLLLLITSSRASRQIKTGIGAALLFSWAGDVFLLFDSSDNRFFIAGLSAFLFAHVAYIRVFISTQKIEKVSNRWNRRVIWISACYTLALITILAPTLGSLLLPVILYAIALSFLLILACSTFSLSTERGRQLVAGASLFVLSDSLLAINKFMLPFPLSSQAVMLTYGLAQWLLTVSFLPPAGSNDKH